MIDETRSDPSGSVEPMTDLVGLVAVYHADGGVRGELSYVLGRLLGTAHCALCDITHRGSAASPPGTRWSRGSACLSS